MEINRSLTARNKGVRHGGAKPNFIVLHDTAGSGTANDAKYLATDPENRGISVDFCVDKSGTIWQMNPHPEAHCTYHAGRSTHFRGWTNGGVNQNSIGIEIAQKANLKLVDGPLYPHVQLQAVAELCASLCKQFNLTAKDITTHANIITDGTRSDPRKFPWDDFWVQFQIHFGGTEDLALDHETQHTMVDRLDYTVAEGDTLFTLANRYGQSVERIKALNNMNTSETLIKVGQVLRIK